MSESSKHLLDKVGGFELEERGKTFLKVCTFGSLNSSCCFPPSFERRFFLSPVSVRPKITVLCFVVLQGKGDMMTFWLLSCSKHPYKKTLEFQG